MIGYEKRGVNYSHPVYATLFAGAVYLATSGLEARASGDGSNEKGFVAPPVERKLPAAPPRSVSSAETFIPGGCTTPMARTEAKRPPRPPVLVTKLKD
jgi:hypothetical protein